MRCSGAFKGGFRLSFGETILESTARSLGEAVGGEVLVSGGIPGWRCVPDLEFAPCRPAGAGPGPLAGIASVILASGARGLFLFAPCDAPGLLVRDASALLAAAAEWHGAFLETASRYGPAVQPAHVALDWSMAERIGNAVERGHLSLRRLWRDLGFRPIMGESMLLNINTAADLRDAGMSSPA
jgi:molybdopterin-guanine dinucleotide biosynthesis protein A